MIYCSLNQNTYYESSANTLDYKIVDGAGNVIYFGHSIKNPRTGINKINITEIIRDYLSNNLEDSWPELSTGTTYVYKQENAFGVFSLINEQITMETYKVLYDYGNAFTGSEQCLSEPINGRIDARMKLFWSRYGDNNTDVYIGSIEGFYKSLYLTTVALESGTITLKDYNASGEQGVLPRNTIAYRKNGGSWINSNTFDQDVPVSISTGDKVEWKIQYTGSTHHRFSSTCNFIAYGNTLSLVYGEHFRNYTNGHIVDLFNGCTKLKNVDNLYIPYEGNSNLTNVFKNCSSIISAPNVPYINTAADSMFDGCTSLVNAPSLIKANGGLYRNTFKRCTSLIKAPHIDFYGSASKCESMFEGCTSLKTTQESLDMETMSMNCFNSMYKNCTSLVTAPALPSMSLATRCYESMFEGCTSLYNAPELPATEPAEICYYHMFKGCTSLINAPYLRFEELKYQTYAGMFEGCTALKNVQDNFVFTVATFASCGSMFSGCTSLEKAPAIKNFEVVQYTVETTGISKVLQYMFDGCSKLKYIKCLTNDKVSAYDSIEHWTRGVSETGVFVKKRGVGWSRGDSGIPEGWTVQEADE